MSTSYPEPASYPEPPYSDELLADLHAGALPDDVAAHVRRRIVNDPAAAQVLDALDRTGESLRELPLDSTPVPPEVDSRIAATLWAIRAESQQSAGHQHDEHAGSETVTDLTEHRRRSTPRAPRTRTVAFILGAAAAVAVVVGVVAVIATGHNDDQSAGVQAQPSTSAETTHLGDADLDGVEKAAALSVLGRTTHAPFESDAALRRCTAANGIPASTPVLGSGEVTVGGSDRVVILLGTGQAGRFDALVVEPGCDTHNPATVSKTRLGG